MHPGEAPGRWSRLLAATGLDDVRIEPKGRVQVGAALELVQAVRSTRSRPSRFVTGRPVDGTLAPIDNAPLDSRPGELPVQRLGYSLQPASGEVWIEDDGLATAFGVFGAPGSGKTHLLLHLLRQVLAYPEENVRRQEEKFGALILDPKSEQIGNVVAMAERLGREDDLEVINFRVLEELSTWVNILDCGLDPFELGQELVHAAMSAGVGASEPYWFGAWKNLFSAATYLLRSYSEEVLTLRLLADAVLGGEETGMPAGPAREYPIQRLARETKRKLDRLPAEQRNDTRVAIERVEAFYRQEDRSTSTVNQLIEQGYGLFRLSAYRRLSHRELTTATAPRSNLYDDIINNGKIVLVSMPEHEPAIANLVCTLVKCLFQRTVLGRHDRVRAKMGLHNFRRPLLLFCDEYPSVATELPGQNMGDAYFFSQARQFGCMALIAAQSVHNLEASKMEKSWKAVLANLAAKLFLRLGDHDTAKEASELAGKSDWYVSSIGTSHEARGTGWSRQQELRERESLPTEILTQVLTKGQAVIIGSLDGSRTVNTWFVQVPREP
jgi:type IV secretory pathway TraG/TraD family ATPase VirD4